MFSKLSLLALSAPLVTALTITNPINPTSGGQATINWTTTAGDPSTWSFELVNVVFHNSFAIANNVNPTLQTLTLELPIVPAGSGYTIEAVNISDINQVFATGASFSIGDVVSSSTSASATGASSGSSGASGATGSTGSAATLNTPTSTGFGSTASSNPSATAPSGAGTTAGSSATSATSPSGTPFNGAASNLRFTSSNAGAFAIMLLSAVAGAAVLAL